MPAKVRTGLFGPSAPTRRRAARRAPEDSVSIGHDERSSEGVSVPSSIEETLVEGKSVVLEELSWVSSEESSDVVILLFSVMVAIVLPEGWFGTGGGAKGSP